MGYPMVYPIVFQEYLVFSPNNKNITDKYLFQNNNKKFHVKTHTQINKCLILKCLSPLKIVRY